MSINGIKYDTDTMHVFYIYRYFKMGAVRKCIYQMGVAE